ncbi:MAG: DUF2914 domain-containing protein [Methylococcales symbiont of Iophon sp. n. MRB-2018]|nr:MAG: DUF2914 domain-containing protein [Methylococcales symbiont of Iophon sp. n. MRB-2018]KAF3979522.1 MAG: DUF2914 domain-containing protein [Methylococcales symbiont of Iophon sp. n. MRB-2018]
MNEDNKVVLKINYQGARREKSEPKMIQEWNTKRLWTALILLLMGFTVFFIYFFEGAAENSEVQKLPFDQPNNLVAATINLPAKVGINSAEYIDKNMPEVKSMAIKTDINVQDKVIEVIKQSPKVLNDPRVARALLTRGMRNKEPIDNIGSFVTVNKSKATVVFYFTELVNMKGQIVFHQWFWKNKPIYAKKFKILGNRWRIATSKVIHSTVAGAWMVRVVDEKTQMLNEIKFKVINE